MFKMRVYFTDGRTMICEPGVTFTGTDTETGRSLEYICFSDNRKTGPLLAKKQVVYYFKLDETTNRIYYSDRDSSEEYEFVKETLANALECPPKGLLCIFQLMRGGVSSVELI